MSIEIKDIKNLRMAFQAGKSTLNEDELKTLLLILSKRLIVD